MEFILFLLFRSNRKDSYKLDWCYEQDEGVSEIYSREVKPLLQGIFDGRNTCVIAYGARGSGKTQMIQVGLSSLYLSLTFEVLQEGFPLSFSFLVFCNSSKCTDT